MNGATCPSSRPMSTAEWIHTYLMDFMTSYIIHPLSLTGIGSCLSHGATDKRLPAMEDIHRAEDQVISKFQLEGMTTDWGLKVADLEQGIVNSEKKACDKVDNNRREFLKEMKVLRGSMLNDIKGEFAKLTASLGEALGSRGKDPDSSAAV